MIITENIRKPNSKNSDKCNHNQKLKLSTKAFQKSTRLKILFAAFIDVENTAQNTRNEKFAKINECSKLLNILLTDNVPQYCSEDFQETGLKFSGVIEYIFITRSP